MMFNTCVCVCFDDVCLCLQGVGADPHVALALPPEAKLTKEKQEDFLATPTDVQELSIRIGRGGAYPGKPQLSTPPTLTSDL